MLRDHNVSLVYFFLINLVVRRATRAAHKAWHSRTARLTVNRLGLCGNTSLFSERLVVFRTILAKFQVDPW